MLVFIDESGHPRPQDSASFSFNYFYNLFPEINARLGGGIERTRIHREIFGMEEGAPVQNEEDMSTEYPYDSRGFRFVRFKVGARTLNAIRFIELKKTT